MSNEVTVHETREIETLPLTDGMNDLVNLGSFIAQSGMLGASSPAAGMIIATTCFQERISLLEFGRRFHVDNRGKVTMRSDRMLAEFMALGGVVEWVQWDKEAAIGKWSYGVNKDKEISFTYAEAKEAGYIKSGSNWEKDPAAQCRARCITRAVRMICPAAVAGVYCPEEMDDVYRSEKPVQGEPVQASPGEANEIPVAKTSQTIVNTAGTPFDNPDFTVCAVQNTDHTGKKWTDIASDQLQYLLANPATPGVEAGHIAEITKILSERGDLCQN